MSNLRQTTRGPRNISYADPANFSNVTNIKLDTRPKRAGSRTVQNVKTSVSKQNTVVLPPIPGCKDACNVDEEVLSINVSLSGSTASREKLIALWNETVSHMQLVIADLTTGFLPDEVTLPLTATE